MLLLLSFDDLGEVDLLAGEREHEEVELGLVRGVLAQLLDLAVVVCVSGVLCFY